MIYSTSSKRKIKKLICLLVLGGLWSIFRMFELSKENRLLSEENRQLSGKISVNTTEDDNVFSMREGYAVFPSHPMEVRLWIDVPNTFPWRKCLHEWDGMVFTHSCSLVQNFEIIRQSMILWPSGEDRTTFRLLIARPNKKLLENRLNKNSELSSSPDSLQACLEPQGKTIRVNKNCSSSGTWRWSSRGLLQWMDEGCLASTGGQAKTILVECDASYDDQIVEIGRVTLAEKNSKLEPYDMEFWRSRTEEDRNREMEASKKEVESVLEEIKVMEENKDFERMEGTRRAVVFYVDKGSGFLSYLTWWIFAWRQTGLNSVEEAFDIILMTHPASINKLPKECVQVPDYFDPTSPGPGQCLYRELVPISERDHKHDNWMNSQECLFNQAGSFLKMYKILIRADLDTFPTPGLVNYWPTDVICYRDAATTHHRANIEDAIIATAEAVGIHHHHWHNTDSAWMGPALRIITLSKLTTYIARFTRAHMFGPGTLCRCATCIDLPNECTWGQGIYAGTQLLYAQEIAMNRLWTQGEYDRQKTAILDASCTDGHRHVCAHALLHARHNADPFSKFTFLRGEYKNYNLGGLDITNLRDYSMFMAIVSAGQGVNTSKPMENYLIKEKGVPLQKLCRENKNWLGKNQNT